MTNLDFSNYIRDHTRDFTGPEWVFEAVNTGSQILKGYAFSVLFQIENHLGVQPDRKSANVPAC